MMTGLSIKAQELLLENKKTLEALLGQEIEQLKTPSQALILRGEAGLIQGIQNWWFEVFINDRRIWNAIKKHTSREVKLERIFEREEKDGIRIRFRKIYKRTGKKLRDFMAGKPLVD